LFPFKFSFEFSLGEIVLILIGIVLITILIKKGINKKNIIKEERFFSDEVNIRNCPARFGFLKKIPRGSVVPEECYVCPRLIECLGFYRTDMFAG
jgi:hypothetical protein